jgi:hypothetical protein
MTNTGQKLMNLKRQLYPTGRAFKMPKDGFLEKLHIALNESEELALNDAKAILDSILPDNINFSEEDASDWERRLGLIHSPDVDLDLRKLSIKRKLNYPGANPAKNHYLWVQQQLQDASFPVYVYENRFDDYPSGYITKSPQELGAPDSILTYIEHGEKEHGEFEHGYVYNNIVANHIDENRDIGFDIGDNFRSTFFISGNPIGTYVNIPMNQKDQFRQLILKLKPVQTVAILFINYT